LSARKELAGIQVLDLGHTVMGPSAALVLADLGADVVHIEPTFGDPTRRLGGFGRGYFAFFNRNKRSVAIDLKSSAGREIAVRLVERADVLIENFAPGTMTRLGLDYPTLAEQNPRLIYASLKGFLDGPYSERLALDEVVQMMSGLAFMTGPVGRPLRAGTSVVDIVGGLFAAIGILAALRDRERTGRGGLVESALFESAVFLMGQHLAYAAQTDGPVPPMPQRVSAWGIYDLFDLADGHQIFVGVTSDRQWARLLDAIDSPELESYRSTTNNERLEHRDQIKPVLERLFRTLALGATVELCLKAVVPFAPVARPEELFDDPHLRATGSLVPTRFPNGTVSRLPRLPIRMDHEAFGLRLDPPELGNATNAVLSDAGYTAREIDGLLHSGVIAASGHAEPR
jgi:crotonobetainyl-CoA:carnitine CoA-transferase CaiB-like acyl-CoA transferase